MTVLDVVVRQALLGVQFRDAATGRVVADGLRVELQDLWQPRRRQTLAANRSGVFALHAFPGMPGFDEPPPASAGRFRLEVQDTLARYVPAALAPPVPSGGLWGRGVDSPAASPDLAPPHVPLYSAATRTPPVGMASLRAELRTWPDDERPVPWARLELWSGSARLAEGVADAAGRVLLVFPLPRPREATLDTSPAGAPALAEWTVTLRAFRDPALAADAVPLFDDILAQPEAALLQASGQPLAPLALVAGEPLVVASPPSSFLYVAG